MQLDRTHVAIRRRSLSELGDLALIMLREYPTALAVGFLAGALPWMLTDLALLGWLPWDEWRQGLDDVEASEGIARYAYWMVALVFLQTPLAGIFMTYYLGQAVFERRPTWRRVFSECRRLAPRCLWLLGGVRLAIPATVVAAWRIGSPPDFAWDVLCPTALLVWVGVVRSSRPFLPEIIVLEQCPMRSTSPDVITVARRNRSLHRPVAGELSGRHVMVSAMLSVLVLAVLYGLMFIRGIAVGDWSVMDLFVLCVLFPLSLWSVAGVSVLVRLLNYLDTRIRIEGWDVELAVRAEAMRQFGDETSLELIDRRRRSITPSRTGATAATRDGGRTRSAIVAKETR